MSSKKSGAKSSSGSFLVQGSILAAAAIIAKIIGMVYRIPLTNILGDTGNSYYSTANEIYSIILMVSSFSLPLAVSRLMAERIQKGEYRNANKIFLCAMRLAVTAGAVMALFTYVFAGVITKYVMNFEYAKYGLRVIAPAILIFAITGTFRGYFQGFGTMVPTAFSQVVEQIVNAILSIVCAGLMYSYGVSLTNAGGSDQLGPAWGAAGGTFGTVGSVSVAMIIMMIMYASHRRTMNNLIRKDHTGHKESTREIYSLLIATIIPIIVSTVIYNISTVLDQGIFNAVLKGQGYSEDQYAIIWGIYTGKFRVLMNVVLALASSIGPAIVPSMTGAIASGNKRDARSKVNLAIRFTMLFSIPCAFGLAALGGPIIEMLFHPTTGVPLSTGIMQAGAPMIILYALSTLTTSILQGMGKLRQPLIHCAAALVIHIIALYIMLRNFNLNIYAVIYANTIFALIVCILNAITIKRSLRYRQEIYKTFFIPVIASVIMAFAAFGMYTAVHRVLGVSVSVIIGILTGMIVYLIAMIAFRGITAKEIVMMPKGKSILRIFRKIGLIR